MYRPNWKAENGSDAIECNWTNRDSAKDEQQQWLIQERSAVIISTTYKHSDMTHSINTFAIIPEVTFYLHDWQGNVLECS